MRIGIIGSGAAGLASAWLLEEHHEVLLFEKNDRFGGHAQTVYVNQSDTQIPIEIGFEFFNERMYPHFCRLLAALNVATRTLILPTRFINPRNNYSCYLLYKRIRSFGIHSQRVISAASSNLKKLLPNHMSS